MRDKNRLFALERVRAMRERLEVVEAVFERTVTADEGVREAVDALTWVNHRSGLLATALDRLLERRGSARDLWPDPFPGPDTTNTDDPSEN